MSQEIGHIPDGQESLESEKEAFLKAVMNSRYFEASDELRNDKDFFLEAMDDFNPVIERASDKLKGDKDFMLKAIKKWGHAFDCLPIELIDDQDLRREAEEWLKLHGGSINFEKKRDEELYSSITHVIFEHEGELFRGAHDSEEVRSVLKGSSVDTTDLQIETDFQKNRAFGDDMGNMAGGSDCLTITISKAGRNIYHREIWGTKNEARKI